MKVELIGDTEEFRPVEIKLTFESLEEVADMYLHGAMDWDVVSDRNNIRATHNYSDRLYSLAEDCKVAFSGSRLMSVAKEILEQHKLI